MERTRQTGRSALSAAFPLTLPVLTGFLVLGMAYGILMQTKGYGPLWSGLMSAVAFCGSMQFAAVTLLTSVFDPLAALALSVMVNARHLFYGLSMLGKYRGMGKAKPFLIFGLCDETFSIVSSVEPPEGVEPRAFYLAITLLDYLYWIGGTLLGGLLGGVLTLNTEGLDFVLTALFVVLFLEQMKRPENRLYGLTGIVCTAVTLLLVGPGRLVIPAMLIILGVLLIGREKTCH